MVNQSLAAAKPAGGLLAQRSTAELPLLERVSRQAERLAVIPALTEEPVVVEALAALL